MEERQATIDGIQHKMSPLYTILATQNPVEQEGTYKLPEAQLDRFMIKITIPYPSLEEEMEILNRHNENARLTRLDEIQPVLTREDILMMFEQVENVYIENSLVRYIASLIQQTRNSKVIYLGASPRASVALMQASKALALIRGREFVTPEDIKQIAPFILQHRILLAAEAEMEGYTPLKVIQRLIEKVEVPK
jgi:MoxR-like ATPase